MLINPRAGPLRTLNLGERSIIELNLRSDRDRDMFPLTISREYIQVKSSYFQLDRRLEIYLDSLRNFPFTKHNIAEYFWEEKEEREIELQTIKQILRLL